LVISFPGGKHDITDEDLTATALRETREEIGLAADRVQLLGSHHSLPNKSFTIRVHPFVGYLKDPFTATSPVSMLNFERAEVASVFTVPLRQLADPTCWRLTRFRGNGPLVPEWQVAGLPGVPANVPIIWGLSAFILDNVLRTLLGVDGLNVQEAWHQIGSMAHPTKRV
jgi:nudix motif 8